MSPALTPWLPMIVSAIILIPTLSVLAWMAFTVSDRLRRIDAAAEARAAAHPPLPRKKRNRHDRDRAARWTQIVNYRRAAAALLATLAVVLLSYLSMLASAFIDGVTSTIAIGIIVAVGGVMGVVLWRWSKITPPQPSDADGGR